jgi:putative flavoprotein involved in K+ transport
MTTTTQYVETIVIGGGQAGLATGYQLSQRGLSFLILDAHARVGDAWRQRWDSLRLFSPARYNGLDGMRQPGQDFAFITKDEMADYLESYAAKFNLPVRTGTRVERLTRANGRFRIEASNGSTYEADNVIVAMANYQRPRFPDFANELSPSITQFHSMNYRNPAQLQAGDTLVVGFGNSGAEIALDVSKTHKTYISGNVHGSIPFRIDGLASRLFLTQIMFRGFFHRVFTLDTPMGRNLAKQHAAGHATPLIRVLPRDLAAAGVERVGRTTGVKDGLPLLDSGVALDVANVIWCTGYQPSFDWIDLPVHGPHGPLQQRGICAVEPGLYFVGLHFQYALSSSMVHGVSRDAGRVARTIVERARATTAAHAAETSRHSARATSTSSISSFQ